VSQTPTRQTYEVRWTDRAKQLKPDIALQTIFQEKAEMEAYFQKLFPEAEFGPWIPLTDVHNPKTRTYDRERIVKLDGMKLLARIIEGTTLSDPAKRPEK
jgi:hypothetical protein